MQWSRWGSIVFELTIEANSDLKGRLGGKVEWGTIFKGSLEGEGVEEEAEEAELATATAVEQDEAGDTELELAAIVIDDETDGDEYVRGYSTEFSDGNTGELDRERMNIGDAALSPGLWYKDGAGKS